MKSERDDAREMILNNNLTDTIRLYEMQLLATANHYDLWKKGGRVDSVKALVKLFYGLVKTTQPEYFIEAGAKTASTSIKVRDFLPHAEICAFEANPYNYDIYRKQFPHKKHDVKYLNLALTDELGDITFKIRKSIGGTPVIKETGRNSILERTDQSTTYEEVTVQGVTLDSYFPLPKSNCIWVDVEGATKQVLKGATKLLQNTKIAMVEVEDKQFWKGQWLSTEIIIFMYNHGLIPVARDFEFDGQYNIIFISKETLSNSEIRRNMEYFHSVLSKNK